jgi:hypothetical protein
VSEGFARERVSDCVVCSTLRVTNQRLVSWISPTVGRLPALRYLQLNNIKMNESLPSTIGNLTTLT